MSRRRRGLLLAALSLLLGGIAAATVAQERAALAQREGSARAVIVAATEIKPGRAIRGGDIRVAQMPGRWAPMGAVTSTEQAVGGRPALAIPRGAVVVARDLEAGAESGAPVARGERVTSIVAVAPPDEIHVGGAVDVLVTRDLSDGAGRATLALEDVEVLAVHQVDGGGGDDGRKVEVELRVGAREAVYLAAAQSYARELRLLPRAAGDTGRGLRGASYTAGSS